MERYIIEVICFQGLFLLVYHTFLKKETFFNYNRWFLVGTPILALILPLIKIETLGSMVAEQYFFTQLPTIFIGDQEATAIASSTTPEATFTINWLFVYGSGVVLSLLFGLSKYIQLYKLYKFQSLENHGRPRIITLPKSDAAFTFFNTVFLGDQLDTLSRKHILSHELVHVKQGHSWDLLLFELLRIIFWFNPLVYIYQKNIALVHEYIADAEASKNEHKQHYYEKLLNATFGTQQLSFVNTFFNHSIIKKRIVMLQKSRSKQIAKIKYLGVLPLILGILI